MSVAGRSRNTPCFCGSGRKLKHCCARQLTPVRTWKHATKSCRWRFYQPHGAQDRYASELAEHICTGDRVWIARGTPDATSWLINDDTVTLFEILDLLPGALYHWAAEQTMNALNDAAANASTAPNSEDPSDHPSFDHVRQLTLEILRLAHAGDALQAHLPAKLRPSQSGDPTQHDGAWTQLAS